MGNKKRKPFWHNFKFKYKLTIINENTLEEVAGLHVSKLNGLSVLLLTCFIIFTVAAVIVVFTPLRNYLPGYMNAELRKQVVMNALKADSLQAALDRHNYYVMNIQDIIAGNVKVDTVQSIDSLTTVRAEALMERSSEEDRFRQEYEERERYNLRAVTGTQYGSGLIFTRPTRGIVYEGFSTEQKHFGIDLTAKVNESVLATLDGTVIFSGYTADAGFMIQIQHTQNFVSIYKYCGALMKQTGDKVQDGEVIAIVGKSADESKPPRIHFELWHRGSAINPEKYVTF